MKHISPTRKIRIAQAVRMRWRKRLDRRERKNPNSKLYADFEFEGSIERRRITAMKTVPTSMCLEENYKQVAVWLQELRESVSSKINTWHHETDVERSQRRQSGRSFFDFSTIQTIRPPVALIIASEYDRLRLKTNSVLGAYNVKQWNPSVRNLLNEMGFFEAIGIHLSKKRISKPEGFVKICRFESGDQLKPEELSKLVNLLVDSVVQVDPEALRNEHSLLATKSLVGALIEATENTRQHAYPEEIRNSATCLPRWWLTGATYPDQKKMTLFVFDQGVSIPGSLGEDGNPNWSGRSFLKRALRLLGVQETDPDHSTDHQKIRLAMAYGRSSTRAGNRGKGLAAIEEVTKLCKEGRLVVLSRFGEYTFTKGGKPRSRALPEKFPGTLVYWELTF